MYSRDRSNILGYDNELSTQQVSDRLIKGSGSLIQSDLVLTSNKPLDMSNQKIVNVQTPT